MSMDVDRDMLALPAEAKLSPPAPPWDGIYLMSGFGRKSHENVIKPFRPLSYCYLVNLVAVQHERCRSVADRNRLRRPASQHHGRRAEAGGKAESSGGNARVRSGGTPSGPDIAIHSSGEWDAVGCAGACHGEACPA